MPAAAALTVRLAVSPAGSGNPDDLLPNTCQDQKPELLDTCVANYGEYCYALYLFTSLHVDQP